MGLMVSMVTCSTAMISLVVGLVMWPIGQRVFVRKRGPNEKEASPHVTDSDILRPKLYLCWSRWWFSVLSSFSLHFKMTSLSSQLKSLQIPDELSVLNVQSKRASILFDSHDAADIDLDTIFTLGLSGLAELENIDADFNKFEKFLFSENVKNLERTQQPAEFNEKLDRKIEEFLAYLTPYFLVKPAQKALEWLIRRFRIHVFNLDALMACILPYHETNLFARVLQILTLKQQNSKWEWLLPVQKAGSPLSKITIIQHCVHNMSFQNFLCDMVLQAVDFNKGRSAEKLKTLISFFTSVLLGIIDAPKNLTENRVGKILPFIYKGLKSKVDDFKSSCYMILSKLSLSVTFEEQIVLALIEQICKVRNSRDVWKIFSISFPPCLEGMGIFQQNRVQVSHYWVKKYTQMNTYRL